MACNRCYKRYEERIGRIFEGYGSFVTKYPIVILIASILANCLLGIGLIRIESENDIEILYTPQNSEAFKDREQLQQLISDKSEDRFYSKSVTDISLYGDIIVQTKNRSNILSLGYIDALESLYNGIKTNVKTKNDAGTEIAYNDTCALRNGTCVVGGDVIFSTEFKTMVQNKNISFPTISGVLVDQIFGDKVVSNGQLQSASMVRLIFYLRERTMESRTLSMAWEEEYLARMRLMESEIFDIRYSVSNSLNTELDDNTAGDIVFFSLTFTLMITYASFATAGGNCVSERQNLGRAGVLTAVISILGAFGLVSAIGVKFVNIVGVMPFLVIGIGIDDMFILMAGLADAPTKGSIEEKLRHTMRTSGVAITITSLTDFLAFAIGASTVFISVRNFCIYTGVAVIFCYINQLTFFLPCMVINERRVQGNRHFGTCQVIPSRRKLDDEIQKKGKCFICCCTGDPVEHRSDNESPLEKYPKILFKKIVSNNPCKFVILIIFSVYLGVSIWGVTQVEQGLVLSDLVSDDSYYKRYIENYDNNFENSIIVTFAIDSTQMYSSNKTQQLLSNMLSKAADDAFVHSDLKFNWLEDFKQSSLYQNVNESVFISSLRIFLNYRPDLIDDVQIDISTNSITSSRFYVFTKHLKTSNDQGDLMKRMRSIADGSGLPCFAFSPAFIFYEQYVAILSTTLQTVGIALAAMLVVTIVFMPQILLVVMVMMTLVSILVGVFGFMYFWKLTLSSVTMIHLIMSIGFSVDFSAHICHAFLSGDECDRKSRVNGAMDRAGGPIFNAAMSSFVGIIMLTASSSYIFISFFKLMMLVILFGLVHAIFVLPVILSVIGPLGHDAHVTNRNVNNRSYPQQTPSHAPVEFQVYDGTKLQRLHI